MDKKISKNPPHDKFFFNFSLTAENLPLLGERDELRVAADTGNETEIEFKLEFGESNFPLFSPAPKPFGMKVVFLMFSGLRSGSLNLGTKGEVRGGRETGKIKRRGGGWREVERRECEEKKGSEPGQRKRKKTKGREESTEK
jgi:hypothetical protein